MSETALARLEGLLAARPGPLLVAVSGGVDSLTLMTVAARVRDAASEAVHALSPAVPPEASERVRTLAGQRGWRLREIAAGEFDDPDYRANPLDRCYFCKANLFTAMRAVAPEGATLCTGTNLDDLSDFRPGLEAAREREVWQPYVEAGLDKAGVRAIARLEGLPAVAELPAQPCLASRVETGIAISAEDLGFVHRIETALTARFGPGDHRCRITRQGVVAQLPPGVTAEIEAQALSDLKSEIAALCSAEGRHFAGVETYRKGSAFRRPPP